MSALNNIPFEITKIMERTGGISSSRISNILDKSNDSFDLDLSDIVAILLSNDREVWKIVYEKANSIRGRLFKNKVWLFAPIYVTNLCRNECVYCAFRAKNRTLLRRTLSSNELCEETAILLAQGHRRSCLIYGDFPSLRNRIGEHLSLLYNTCYSGNSMNEVCINAEPPTEDEFVQMLQSGFPVYYRVFQETYDQKAFKLYHKHGPKSHFYDRLRVFDNAIHIGVKILGLGVLFGLTDWKYDVACMVAHAQYLREKYGVEVVSISIPRIRHALGTMFTSPYSITDETLMKIVSIIRISIPWAHIIVSTREPLELRLKLLEIGATELSAGSSTAPKGYSSRMVLNTELEKNSEQFVIEDRTDVGKMTRILTSKGYQVNFDRQFEPTVDSLFGSEQAAQKSCNTIVDC